MFIVFLFRQLSNWDGNLSCTWYPTLHLHSLLLVPANTKFAIKWFFSRFPMGIRPLQEERRCSAVTRYAAVNTRKYSSSCQAVAPWRHPPGHMSASAADLGLHGLCTFGIDLQRQANASQDKAFQVGSTMIFYLFLVSKLQQQVQIVCCD